MAQGETRSYRELVRPPWEYIGTDVQRGRNVDIQQPGAHWLPFCKETADAVMCGQVLEHVEHPWELVREIARVIKPGGFAFLIAPREWPVHRHPVDCWRILPDGMAVLMRGAGLEVLQCFLSGPDTAGVGKKPGRAA